MRSLSLTAYKALARGSETAEQTARPERPSGRLVWAVAQDEASLRALVYLADRLQQVHGACTVVISSKLNAPHLDPGASTILCAPPADTQASADAFLNHWKPDLCLWTGGNLQPVVIASAKARSIPMLLLNAREDYLDQPVLRWLPSIARESLTAFDVITAETPEGRRTLRRMDARREIKVTGPMQVSAPPPGVNESVYDEISEALAGRPVWLAARVQEAELHDVLEAHRAAIRITHRLLLVLVAASFPVSLEARRQLDKLGWRVCHWEDGDPVDENTQVILVEEPEDMGLWYRVSPVSFLASSLVPGVGGCDPYAPASLGSAIVYGPNVGSHMSAYSRLAAVGAARIIKDTASLARQVQRLLAADQAATMAHAAWETISDGADVTDQVIDMIQDRLDSAASHT